MSIKLRNLHPEVRSRLLSGAMELSPNANIVYVDSGHANAGTGKLGTNSNNPMSTIDSALEVGVSGIQANNGDMVVCLPGHAETISSATDLVPDVAGVSIIGIGVGADRPTLTLDAAGSNIPISADSVLFQNFLIVPTGTVNVASAITVTGDDCVLESVEERESSATSQFVLGFFLNVALRVKLLNCKFLGAAGDATITAVRMTGSTGLEIAGCDLVGTFQGSADATGAIQSLTTLNVDIRIHDNVVENRDGTSEAGIVFVATDTGLVYRNFIAVPTGDFLQGLVAPTGMRQYDNFVVDVATERGAPIGTASA